METITEKFKRNLANGTLTERLFKAAANRLIKWLKYATIFYFLDPERVMTKKYQKEIPKINFNHFPAGNYYLDQRIPLDRNSIVYSLGILTDITFDLFVSNQYHCNIYMYDPSPISIALMKKYESNKLLKYSPVGVWTENSTLRFYEPLSGGSASAVYQMGNHYFEAECFTMETLMQKNKHFGIDVFKADVEGAALPILEQMVNNGITPGQIIAEFERPRNNMKDINMFFNRISEIRNKLKEKGYEEFLLPRKYAKYYSLEMLFVDTKQIKK